MTRLLTMLVMLLISAPAAAEWVKYAESDRANLYYDPATVRVNGHYRRVWVIQDLKQRAGDGVASNRVLDEYDCKEERTRILSYSAHSEPMANGNTLRSVNSPGEWSHIPPGTISDTLHKLLCRR